MHKISIIVMQRKHHLIVIYSAGHYINPIERQSQQCTFPRETMFKSRDEVGTMPRRNNAHRRKKNRVKEKWKLRNTR